MTSPSQLNSKFNKFVTSRCGLYFKDHDLKNLEDAIKTRMKLGSFDSPSAYYTYITTSKDKENEFRELLNLLTIHHTYFYRNEPQFKALEERVLPEIMKKQRKSTEAARGEKPQIRIWSAGCSTGEEPYSIAMTVIDTIKELDQWDIRIYATDASTDALEKAKRGIYSKSSMRLVNKKHREKYFTARRGSGGNTKYEVKSEIKNIVDFDYFNLMEEVFPTIIGFDIIFCRNVVIYFDLETTLKVMNGFHGSLVDDGYLFIGYSENLQFIPGQFKMEHREGAIFYHKVTKKITPDIGITKAPVEKTEPLWENAPKEEVAVKSEAKGEKTATSNQKTEELLAQIVEASHLKEYNKALSLIEKVLEVDKNSVSPYYLAAEIYANQGRFDEAKEKLAFTLKLNSLFAPAHYLFGSIYMEEEDFVQAKNSLKRALFLDKNFALAHFILATVHRKEGRINDANREYRNALKALSQSSPETVIDHSGGLTAATLASVCKNSLERLEVKR